MYWMYNRSLAYLDLGPPVPIVRREASIFHGHRRSCALHASWHPSLPGLLWTYFAMSSSASPSFFCRLLAPSALLNMRIFLSAVGRRGLPFPFTLYSRTPLIRPPSESHWCGRIRGMVAREGFVYEQKPLSVTRNVVVWEGWWLVRVVVRQGFYCTDNVLESLPSSTPLHVWHGRARRCRGLHEGKGDGRHLACARSWPFSSTSRTRKLADNNGCVHT